MKHILTSFLFIFLWSTHAQAQVIYFHNLFDGVFSHDLQTQQLNLIFTDPWKYYGDIVIDKDELFYTVHGAGMSRISSAGYELLFGYPTGGLQIFMNGMAIDKDQTLWGLGMALGSYHIPTGTSEYHGFLPNDLRCRGGMYLFLDTLYFNSRDTANQIMKITSVNPLEIEHFGYLSDSIPLAGFTMFQRPCGDVQYLTVGIDSVIYNFDPRTLKLDSIAPRLTYNDGIAMSGAWRLGGYNMRINLDKDTSGGLAPIHWQDTARCGDSRLFVGDEDICMYSDSPIDSIVVWLEQTPDGLDDRLYAAGLVPGVNVMGQGSQRLVLYPSSGNIDFMTWSNALGQIYWQTDATNPNAGTRIAHVLGFSDKTCPDTAIAYLHLDTDYNKAGQDIAIILCAADTTHDLHQWLSADAQSGGIWVPDTDWGGGIYHPIWDGAGDWKYIVNTYPECPADTSIISIDVLPLPQPDLGPDLQLCEGEEYMLSTSTSYNTYTWNGLPGGPTLLVNQSGNYTLEVTDAFGCAGQDVVLVTLIPINDTIWTNVEVCQGEVYSWEGETFDQTGIYIKELPSQHGCDSLIALNLKVLPDPFPIISGDTILCPDAVGFLDVGSYDKIQWSTGANTSVISIEQAGTYSVTVTASEGCTSVASITVTQAESIEAQWIAHPPSCQGKTDASIQLSSLTGGYGQVKLLPENLLAFPGYTIEGLASGMYDVLLQDDAGCLHNTTIEMVDPPLIWIDAGELIVKDQDAIILQSISTNATSPWNLNWIPQDGLKLLAADQLEVSTSVPTNYNFVLTDSQGCIAETSLEVRITYSVNLYLPTAFSPNQDGINDQWLPIPPDGKSYEIQALNIYDRWGGLLYSTKGKAGEVGWDGYASGKLLDAGVYVYDLLIVLPDRQQHHVSGEINLIR